MMVLTLETDTPRSSEHLGRTPFLTLSNGGQAAYSGVDGSGRPQFTYTVAGGEDTSNLTVTGLTSNGGSLSDAGQTSFVSAANVGADNGPRSVAAADINGDGRLDLLVANANSDTVSVRLGVGDGTFTSAADVSTEAAPSRWRQRMSTVTGAKTSSSERQQQLVVRAPGPGRWDLASAATSVLGVILSR